jgi:RND family efflux transporter MFP subunit
LKTGSVSKQDADDKVAAAAADNALVAAAQANVNRLHELVSFERIVAPLDGVITARNTDTGALIDAGSNGTGPELFHIAETDKLRVYVQVPEMYVDAIKPDLTADMKLGEYPGRSFPAKLSNTADALDPNTRTLLIELEVDNDKGELLPGGFAEVHLKLPAPETTVILPVNTLLFRAQGMQVATVDDESHVQLKSIVIGQDYGTQVQVKSGITPGENIIVNPPDSIATGQTVHVQNNGDDKDDGKDGQSGDDNGGDDKNSDGKNTDGTDKNKDGGE